MVSSTGHGHASLKRIHYQAGKFAVANIVTACTAKPGAPVDMKYLWLLLDHSRDRLIVPLMKGTANVSLSQRSLAGVPIPLPTLAEQRRIVDLIGTLDDTLDAALQSAAAAHQSLLCAADELHERWPERVSLATLAPSGGLVGGPFGSSLVSRDYTEGGVPVIRGTNMRGNGAWVGGEFVYVSEEKAASLARNQAVPGDVVFTQRGTLGQVALVPDGPHNRYVVSQSQMRLRIDSSRDLAKFVYYSFLAPRTVQTIQARNTATANPHINLGILSAMTVPRPSLEDQAEAVSRLDTLATVAQNAFVVEKNLRDLRSHMLAALLSGEHEIPESYDAPHSEA